ncbi:5951_t:CDS:2 [Gigaspora rosea]|nr:5951_t:CDS:2 [Gigaspora rosea]
MRKSMKLQIDKKQGRSEVGILYGRNGLAPSSVIYVYRWEKKVVTVTDCGVFATVIQAFKHDAAACSYEVVHSFNGIGMTVDYLEMDLMSIFL